MTKIAEIEDRGATIAWSPVAEIADVIALGAKVCSCLAGWLLSITTLYIRPSSVKMKKRFFSFIGFSSLSERFITLLVVSNRHTF